ncbi:MAG: ABC-ATPase domain-containing protein, partial [Phycisphaerae bacterium]
MPDAEDLRKILARIDGRGYKAYKDLGGTYDFDRFTLYIDHVQSDPFASPSKVRVRVPQSASQLPGELSDNCVRRIALEDFLARQVRRAIRGIARGNRGTGKSGLISIDAGGQGVLERTAVVIASDWVEARLEVGLPAAGRRVMARQAETMLCRELPAIVARGLIWPDLPQQEGQSFVACVENQEHIRDRLDVMGLVAFVADGAILPRESGASDRPLPREQAVPFQSPQSLRVTVEVPHPVHGSHDSAMTDWKVGPTDGMTDWEVGPTVGMTDSKVGPTVVTVGSTISGLGIPKGVTLIVGGGYHGKSTLLKALERGVYPHIPGDGREYVVTNRDTVKIRAEEGRRVECVDISPFITDLPYGRDTTAFCTDDASGSTSQAANILEAIEAGATALLLDEDTSATNFMVRDGRMQALVHKEHEPITPFLDRVRELY